MRYIFILSFLFFHTLTVSHGFGPNTPVQSSDGSQKTIHNICLYTLHNKISVISYDISGSFTVNKHVKIGKRSGSNCYIRLGFDAQFNDDDILCTPLQEFYMPVNHSWVPAYMLKCGDALLTKDMTTKPITYKEFVPKPLKMYMLEIHESHTFFVGKHAILTHNIFLPGITLGLSIPFGSVATGAIGSFFGPIGLIGGIVLGGVASIAIKAVCENRIQRYKIPKYNIGNIEYYCRNMTPHENITAAPAGCFTIQDPMDTSCTYPIETPLSQTPIGCIEIEINGPDKKIVHNYDKNSESQEIYSEGCFQPTEQNGQLSFYSQEKPLTIEKPNSDNKRLTARNWDEFEKNCPIGQKYGKKFIHTGKQNPKDKSPIRKLSENIPNTEMFKKGYYFAPDRFHGGDHFEVWDKNGNWVGVANLDGSKNEKKTNAEKDKPSRSIKKII